MAKKPKLSEEIIAEIAKLYFSSKGWDLYPEVVIPIFGGRPDYVGVKQQLSLVIECKTSLTYPVLEQLTRWRHEAEEAERCHYLDSSSKAVPHLLVAVCQKGNDIFPPLKKEILMRHRIGYYAVNVEPNASWPRRVKDGVFDDHGACHWKGDVYRVIEVVNPKLQVGSRRTGHKIIEHLNQDMLMGIAGSSGTQGAYMTPFKRTMNKAKTVLKENGDCHIDTLVKLINRNHQGHHYSSDSSAKNGIGKFLIKLGIAYKPDENRPVYRLAKELTTSITRVNAK